MAPKKKKTSKKKSKTTTRKKKSTSSKPSLMRTLFKWGFVAGLWGMFVLAAAIAWLSYDLPDIQSAVKFDEKRPTIIVLAANGDELARYGDMQAMPVKLENISPFLLNAVIAIEDRRFYNHFGIDPLGLARAMVSNFKAGRIVQGGSTITQQLAKNLFLTPQRTLTRKAKEALLALYLENKYSKDEILAAYLNRVYLGAGTYGVEAAANNYFKKSAAELDLVESAIIAGLLKAPSRYAPSNDPELTKQRTTVVINAMLDAGYISDEQAQTEIIIPDVAKNTKRSYGGRYFADWVMEEMRAYVENAEKDLIVQTTLNPEFQTFLNYQINRTLDDLSENRDAEQGAGIIMGHDGAVHALVGGRDYDESQFNRATQAKRQPGSAFKPVVYLTLMQQGYDPTDTIMDAPVQIGDYRPTNFKDKYRGELTLQHSLALSLNTVAVMAVDHAGISNVKDTALQLGITDRLNHDLSIALGTSEMDLMGMTSVYAIFANGGHAVQPYGVKEIRDIYGNLIFQYQSIEPIKIVEDGPMQNLNAMLKSVVRQGTGRFSSVKDIDSAGKTGTSQNFRDAWFIGYNSEFIMSVWYGNDDNSEMAKVTGGNYPATTWRYVMRDIYRTRPLPPKLYGYEPKRLRFKSENEIDIIPDDELEPHIGSFPIIDSGTNSYERYQPSGFKRMIDNLSNNTPR